MIDPHRRLRPSTVALLASGVLLLGGLIWSWRPNHGTVRESVPPAASTEVQEVVEPVRSVPEPVVLASRTLSRKAAPEIAADGVPIMGPGDSDSTANGPRHPHPITAQHQRIFKENSLLGSLNGAMDVEDAAALRRLNEQYKKEFPDDPQALQSGYDLIADCLEQRTEETRTTAERYFDEQRGSTLRRWVKRYCLQ